ncbi:MAG: sulfotransferase [Longimicrobiales bacterium]
MTPFGRPRDVARRLAETEPVVVMSRGHSGTRVLAWALDALGVRMGTLAHEPAGDCQDRRFTGTIKRIAMARVSVPVTAPPRARDLRRFRRAAWHYLEWLEHPRGPWGWKFPETYLIGGVVDAVFPRARHLHMIRDGRDVAFKAHLTDDEGRRLGRRLLGHLGLLGRPRHVQAARSWAFQLRRFGALRPLLGGRVHRLTFEDLCRSPHETMTRVADFLEVPMTDACRRYLDANVRVGKVAQHRNEDPDVVAEVESHIGDTLETWGYVPDDA